MMMTAFYFILAALALGILVFIHELGHYFAARRVGMNVEIFSIGFGRPLLKWKWQNVDWQLGWLPFGGYVKITGMELGKKEKQTYVEPYEIPNGFFAQSPLRRILVAIAGPLSNFILAIFLFFLLWSLGGREKPFSEFTHIIGWVDPKSELYSYGVRPGDLISKYDGKEYTSSKDLLYAAMLGDKKVWMEGYHVNYITMEKKPFSYEVTTYPAPTSLDGILTTGISTGARFLIYEKFTNNQSNPLSLGSPMDKSGIQYGDQIVWADGMPIFSLEQLSYLLNEGLAFLTVKRNNEIFYTRQSRLNAGELLLPGYLRNELMDWQYEAGIKGRWQDLKVLPYILTADAVVEGDAEFLDKEAEKEAFPNVLYSHSLDQPLKRGDRIVAIDGVPISTAYQLLDLIQTHHVQMIVHRGEIPKNINWEDEDLIFEKTFNLKAIQNIAGTVGTHKVLKEYQQYVLLNPVEPKKMNQMAEDPVIRQKIQEEYVAKKREYLKIHDQEKRNRALYLLEQSKNKYVLGILLQDLTVTYNPAPLVMAGKIVIETWHTLKALFMGYLNPKWISGPVGIVQVIHHGWKMGIKEALFWIGAISMNLGILNLLPIPVLDGGYICLSLWELVTRRKIKAKTMEKIIIPFVVLLVALLIFLTFQDVTRFFS